MTEDAWPGVTDAYRGEWKKIFNAATPAQGIHLHSACPICGLTELYRYYALERLEPRMIEGVMFKGRGSLWQWCSACHSFEHYSAYVPLWWSFELPQLDHAKLTAIPDMIDNAIQNR